MRHVPALDGLRAVAILSVMTFHAGLPLALGGSLGVDVFFVISGWLITTILIDEIERTGTIDYISFLRRRSNRLLPALITLLISYILAAPFLLPEFSNRSWFDAATAFLYLTNIRQTFWPMETPLSHTWSLAIEAQFYLLWPFVISALLRLARKHAVFILLGSWIGITACRFLWQYTIGGDGAYYFSPLHSTGLLLGAVLALRPTTSNHGTFAFGILIAMMIGIDTHQWPLLVQPIAEIAATIIIADPPQFLHWHPLRFIGRISYGIYLWHIPLLWAMPSQTPLQVIAIYFISILCGWLSYAMIESRFPHSWRSTKTSIPIRQTP